MKSTKRNPDTCHEVKKTPHPTEADVSYKHTNKVTKKQIQTKEQYNKQNNINKLIDLENYLNIKKDKPNTKQG